MLKNPKLRKTLLFIIDFLITLFAAIVSLFVRFGFDFQSIGKFFYPSLIQATIMAISYILNFFYNIVWAYTSPRELLVILRGTLLGYLATLGFFYFYKEMILPRSVGFLTFLGALVLISASRLFLVWYNNNKFGRTRNSEKRIAILGANNEGVALLEEINRRPELGKVVCFVDDEKKNIGRKIRGIPVKGPTKDLKNILENNEISELIIALPNATSKYIREIVNSIRDLKIDIKVLPGIYELTDNKLRIVQLRQLNVEDIIGRQAVKINFEEIKGYIKGKIVLVTGAGGSIGSEICRQVAKLNPKELLLLGRGENSIYEIFEKLREIYPELPMKRVIADVSDAKRMKMIFKKFKPDIVFHAAAHKHVDIMQENPVEAFRVNSFGTKVLADLSDECNVERFIFISTDKAVKPSSIMGLSKRLGEIYIKSIGKVSKTNFGIVRFGNVFGSRGSVPLKFKKQIESGGPVTITDPRMKRFFMTIPEAVALVLQAGAYAKRGDLFVLDMGEQILIEDLAREMILMAGLVPDRDIKIVYTGIRPGEKLTEELLLEDEKASKTNHPKILKVEGKNDSTREEISELITKILEIGYHENLKELKDLVLKYVPDLSIDL